MNIITKTLLVTLMLLTMCSLAFAKLQEPFQIIQKEGQFIFTDNASYYRFKKDGSFQSNPIGLSGRTITGHWKLQNSHFIIEGQWGWLNGLSLLDDFRRMTIGISDAESFEKRQDIQGYFEGEAKVYKCYFVMEELVRIPSSSIK